uniref:Cytochrome c oxidase subunit 2 n=1 Tax=Lampsilis powellii TaxID=106594 RepID=A0A4Y1KQ27_9BIVA|nr:cytochrome c oxidase subunit 2 [Lampsilis powellii]
MSFWGQFGLQEGVSVLGAEMYGLHDYAMLILVVVFSFVSFSMFKVLLGSFSGRIYLEKQWLEVVWTLAPFLLLLALGLPSIKLLYLMDEIDIPEVTVKVIGHQWYWSYEYKDFRGSQYGYDSYMANDSLIEGGSYRMLEVDNRCVVSCLLQMRGLITSDDVVHSWAIPSASIKADGVPGRTNQVGLCFLYPGVFYGQCSELCGVNHSFMPVCVEAVSSKVFGEWIMGNHNINMNASSGFGNRNRSCLVFIGDKIYWVFYSMFRGTYFVVELYFKWWFYLLKFGIYWPVKFVFESTFSLTTWALNTTYSLVVWFVWFLSDPVDASTSAIVWLGGKAFSIIHFSVTSPVMAFVWLTKKVWSLTCLVANLPFVVFDAWMNCMSSFSDNETKQWVVMQVARSSEVFYKAMVEYYSKK